MARDKLTEYSATAGDNTVCGDVNIAENSALPSDLNNFAREIMSHLKNFSDGTDAIDALNVDNINLNGNTISSTDTNGNIVLDPNGTGKVVAEDIISTTTNGDINITPNGSGAVVIDGLSHPTADGTAGHFLKTDGSGNLSFAEAGGGKVLQVKQSLVRTGSSQTTSSTFAEITADYRVTITPSSTSSKILLWFFLNPQLQSGNYFGLRFYRSINGGSYSQVSTGNGNEAFRNREGERIQLSTTVMHYDSPSTTSQIIYTPYFARVAGNNVVDINDNGMGSFMIAMEIGA